MNLRFGTVASAAIAPGVVREFVRFAIVGVISNAVLFAFYLVMTESGVGAKLAATVAYAVGVVQTFFFNRSWSFGDKSARGPAFIRYVVAYALGYVFNMVALVALVDRAGYPHRWVQGATILVLAVMLYLLQKLWVFRGSSKG